MDAEIGLLDHRIQQVYTDANNDRPYQAEFENWKSIIGREASAQKVSVGFTIYVNIGRTI